MVNLYTLLAAIDEDHFRIDVRQDGSLLQRLAQRVLIVRIARHRTCPDHQSLLQRRHDRHLDAELVAHSHLAFADALDLRCMQRVQLVLVLRPLVQDAAGAP